MKRLTCEEFREECLEVANHNLFLSAPDHIKNHWQQCSECQQEWYWWQEYRPYVQRVFMDEEQAVYKYSVANGVMKRITHAPDRPGSLLSLLLRHIGVMKRWGVASIAVLMLIFSMMLIQSTLMPEYAVVDQHQQMQAFAGPQLALGSLREGPYQIQTQAMVASIGEPLKLVDANTGTPNLGLVLSLSGMLVMILMGSWLTRKQAR